MEARILGATMIAIGYGKGYSAAAIAVRSLITASLPPSIGLKLYGFVGNVSIGLMNVSIEECSIESIPFIVAIVALTALLVFMPSLVLWLPNLAFG